MADVESNCAYWRCKTQPSADGVGVVISDVAEAHVLVDVATVVKNGHTQSSFYGNRNAELRVQNHQLLTANRYLNKDTSGRIGRIAASRNVSLWSGTVQRESAQGTSPTGIEQFADRNVAAGKGLFQTNAQAIGPDDACADMAVISSLAAQAREIYARAQSGGIEINVCGFIKASMRIKAFMKPQTLISIPPLWARA